MKPLALNDIESELSYAYLHAVCSRAGMTCKPAVRTEDNNGIDAQITCYGPFPAEEVDEERDIKIQLKATTHSPGSASTHVTYTLRDIGLYDELRKHRKATLYFLVVLFLPENRDEWLIHTPQELVLKKCAYWVNLTGAPTTTNTTGINIKIPINQEFNPKNLLNIFHKIASGEKFLYEAPA
jgi:hypothetical protein